MSENVRETWSIARHVKPYTVTLFEHSHLNTTQLCSTWMSHGPGQARRSAFFSGPDIILYANVWANSCTSDLVILIPTLQNTVIVVDGHATANKAFIQQF